jgi:hypothetical protein
VFQNRMGQIYTVRMYSTYSIRLHLPSSSDSTVVSTSALLSSPVQSTVSIGTTQPVSDNTVAPSRYNPYQEKTMFLKGKIDRKTAQPQVD